VRLRLRDLGDRRGQGVRIAVIDSGVHASHAHVQGVAGGAGVDSDGRIVEDFTDRLGHGTAVAAVIREKAPAAELLAVKIFDRELRTTGDALVAALRWARTARVRLINLSLGTDNPAHEPALAAEVSELLAAGIDIVTAAPQMGVAWLPGTISGVVGVELDMALPRDEADVAIDKDGAVRIRASGYPRPIPGVPPERNLKGVSFAVANATRLLACALSAAGQGATIAAALGAVRSTSPSA
jgi:subtilisin family serine protease